MSNPVKLKMLEALARRANDLGRQTADSGKVTAMEFNQLCYLLYDLIGTLRQEEEAKNDQSKKVDS